MHDRLGGDIARGTRSVLDDKLLAKSLREPLSNQPSSNVDPASGGSANDDSYRPRGICLCPSDARHGRQRGGARGQMQKLSSVGTFHLSSLWIVSSFAEQEIMGRCAVHSGLIL